MAKKNIVIFLDGTWNDPEDQTRVWAAKNLISATHKGVKQDVYYDAGLGTQKFEKFQGGVFGKGLGKNVRQAYAWLVDTYKDGDNVYIFGFSRGSFTATSVTGMIMRWGLIRPNSPLSVEQIFKLYEKWDKHTPLYQLVFDKRDGRTDFSALEQQLLDTSRRIKIKMIGIWDSVATVGVPFGNFARFSKNALRFHNPRISTIYENVFHALAIDEHRKPFRPILFHFFYKRDATQADYDKNKKKYADHIEQRWFSGSHGDVGGGDNIPVSNAPYAWLLSHAQSLGLGLNSSLPVTHQVHKQPLNNPFSTFIFGLYKIVRFGKRYYRTIGAAPKAVKNNGMIETLSETIDTSVIKRWQTDANYRPKNLERWAAESGVDLDTVSGDIHIVRQR